MTAAPDDGGGAFCAHCGAGLRFEQDQAPTCPECGHRRYRNPAVGVAVILRDDAGRVLLGRRAKGAYAGLWCIPCGYVEWGEEVRAAAEREFAEETGIRVEAQEVEAVHSNFHNAKQLTVGVWFRGVARGPETGPTDGELDALEYFDPGDPPALAFPTDAVVLHDLGAQRRRGEGQ